MGKRGPSPKKLASLFRLKYREGISEKAVLAKCLGVSIGTLHVYEHRLRKKLVKRILQVTPERLQLVCEDCLEARVYEDPETGEKACTSCGCVQEQEPEMIHRLSFDETYAPEAHLAFNNSLGGTVSENSRTRVIARVRNSKTKIEAINRILTEYNKGSLSLFEAGQKTHQLIVSSSAEDISSTITKSAKNQKQKTSEETAILLWNKYAAIPVRQITTIHDVHEPRLIRKMKEYGEKWTRQANRGNELKRLVHNDLNNFRDILGKNIERVGYSALEEPDLKSQPMALTAAVFMKTVQSMNPKATTRNLGSSEKAIKFVSQIMRRR